MLAVLRRLNRAAGLGPLILVPLLALACSSQAALPATGPERLRTETQAVARPAQLGTLGTAGTLAAARQPLEEPFIFEHLSLEQGLSQSVVSFILQDSTGFMWFGTQDGLNRYDGRRFLVFKRDRDDPNSLSASFIQGLYEDSGGGLWIGTNGGGLNRMDLQTGAVTAYRHDPQDPSSLSHDAVSVLLGDSLGALWIGTSGGGLNRLDPESEKFVRFQSRPDDPSSLSSDAVSSIYEDQDGVIWVGTLNAGLNALDPTTGQFVRYQHDPDDPLSLSDGAVAAIFQDRDGVLWVGTDGGGLDRRDPATGGFAHYRHDPDSPASLSNDHVWAIYEDSTGTLWIGTFGGGLDRFDRGTGRFVHHRVDPDDPRSLGNDQVLSIYEDRTGALWIGTFGGGVDRLDPHKPKFLHYRAEAGDPDSLSENSVWAVHEDESGAVWVGTGGGGLNRLDPETGRFTHYRNDPQDKQSLSHDVVWAIYEDSGGTLWVGTYLGLDSFDPSTGRFEHYSSPPVFAILRDGAGVLWIGTWGGGLGRLDPGAAEFRFYHNDPLDPGSLGHDSVLDLLEDREGTLWVATYNGGLNRFDAESEQFVRYQYDPEDAGSLSSNTVLCIHQDREGLLWIGTGGGGLDRLDTATMAFSHFTEKDGLANDTVYGILEEAGSASEVGPGSSDEVGPRLWLSTNKGLSRLDVQSRTFHNYDVGDGLQSSEFNQGAYHAGRSGQMYFGGINGLNAFRPDQVRDNPYVPPVVLTGLSQGGEAVDLGATVERLADVRFAWPRNFFEFEFAALNYAQPQENQYAYRLEGFDPEWIAAGTQPLGRYTNLPGGTYTLQLRGSNNDGLWNEQGQSVTVTVVPPLWERGWFLGLGGLLLVGGAFAGFRLRVRSIQARSRDLEILVAARTKDLAALNAVSSAVSRSLDLRQVLAEALETTLRVTGTDAGGVYLLDEVRGRFRLAAHRGLSAGAGPEGDGPEIRPDFLQEVVQTGNPLVVRDVPTGLTGLGAGEDGFRSMVCLPLSSKGQVVGVLCAVTREDREFTAEDLQLCTSISQQIGVAVDNARLYEQAQQLAVVEERQRLARDLHDSVTQALFAMTLYSEAAAAELSLQELDTVAEYLQELQSASREALTEMRLLIHELRPAVLDKEGLVVALQTRLQAVEGRAGLKTQFLAEFDGRLPLEVEEGLYRIAREALNNTLKHAQAGSVKVRLSLAQPGNRAVLEIVDDGVGFHPEVVEGKGGMGMSAMLERAEELGGKLTIDSAAQGGTKVVVEVPV